MLSSNLWWPPVDCSWSLAEGGKEGHWLTRHRDSSASLVRASPHHHLFKAGPLTPFSFSYHKSAGPWHPQCSLPLRAGLSPAPGQGSHGFPEPPGAGTSCEVRGVHKDHLGARGASEDQQSALPGQGDSSHRSHIAGPQGEKRSWQLPPVSHSPVMWRGSKTGHS